MWLGGMGVSENILDISFFTIQDILTDTCVIYPLNHIKTWPGTVWGTESIFDIRDLKNDQFELLPSGDEQNDYAK